MPAIALCARMTLPAEAVPAWIHLLPAGVVTTKDGRGPYRIGDVPKLIAASMSGGKLPIDENHSTDLAAPLGQPSPARGWIVALQQRADGVWGRVEWTGTGRRLMAHREYSSLSPVILHDQAGAVSAILRASLTNTPNLTGLTSLHAQSGSALSGLSTSREIMQKARALQAQFERRGLPIDLTSAIASVMEEETPAAPSGDMTPTDDDMVGRLGLDRTAYQQTKSPSPPDARLSSVDLDMIARLGLDPATYLKNQKDGAC